MDKKLRKVIQSMRPYIGQQIIRIAPAIYPSGVGVKDYSYGSEPVILRGFSSKGEARITRSDKWNRQGGLREFGLRSLEIGASCLKKALN